MKEGDLLLQPHAAALRGRVYISAHSEEGEVVALCFPDVPGGYGRREGKGSGLEVE